jgi:hypothetical protein
MTSLQEAIEGWAKQTDMYEQAIKERDEWKDCAEELAEQLELYHKFMPRHDTKAALTRFNKLKGQTK